MDKPCPKGWKQGILSEPLISVGETRLDKGTQVYYKLSRIKDRLNSFWTQEWTYMDLNHGNEISSFRFLIEVPQIVSYEIELIDFDVRGREFFFRRKFDNKTQEVYRLRSGFDPAVVIMDILAGLTPNEAHIIPPQLIGGRTVKKWTLTEMEF